MVDPPGPGPSAGTRSPLAPLPLRTVRGALGREALGALRCFRGGPRDLLPP